MKTGRLFLGVLLVTCPFVLSQCRRGQEMPGSGEKPAPAGPKAAAPAGPASHKPLETRPEYLIALSDLKPVKSEFGFIESKMDYSVDGSPLTLASKDYEKGIGMHAPSSMVFAVPADVESFQAKVGLGPGAKGCQGKVAVFMVKDESGRVLFSTPPVRPDDPPIDIVIPVKGLREIALVSDEGGDDRDCDHMVWALTSFVRSSPVAPAAAAPAK